MFLRLFFLILILSTCFVVPSSKDLRAIDPQRGMDHAVEYQFETKVVLVIGDVEKQAVPSVSAGDFIARKIKVYNDAPEAAKLIDAYTEAIDKRVEDFWVAGKVALGVVDVSKIHGLAIEKFAEIITGFLSGYSRKHLSEIRLVVPDYGQFLVYKQAFDLLAKQNRKEGMSCFVDNSACYCSNQANYVQKEPEDLKDSEFNVDRAELGSENLPVKKTWWQRSKSWIFGSCAVAAFGACYYWRTSIRHFFSRQLQRFGWSL